MALIRQYEIKDRKERRRLAEKRRLLEKAKMKGRKGKKATKNAAKNAAAQQPVYQPNHDPQAQPEQLGDGQGGLDEDYAGVREGDEYDEQVEAPHPPHASPPKHPPPDPQQRNSRQPGHQTEHGQAGGGPGRAG